MWWEAGLAILSTSEGRLGSATVLGDPPHPHSCTMLPPDKAKGSAERGVWNSQGQESAVVTCCSGQLFGQRRRALWDPKGAVLGVCVSGELRMGRHGAHTPGLGPQSELGLGGHG